MQAPNVRRKGTELRQRGRGGQEGVPTVAPEGTKRGRLTTATAVPAGTVSVEALAKVREHLMGAAELLRSAGTDFTRLSWLIEDVLAHIEDTVSERELLQSKADAFDAETIDSIVQSFEFSGRK